MEKQSVDPDQDLAFKFPTIHFSGPEALPIPKHGNMLVHYQVTREQNVKHPVSGKEEYSCDITVKHIISAEGVKDERPAHSHDEAGEALDKLMEAKNESLEAMRAKEGGNSEPGKGY